MNVNDYTYGILGYGTVGKAQVQYLKSLGVNTDNISIYDPNTDFLGRPEERDFIFICVGTGSEEGDFKAVKECLKNISEVNCHTAVIIRTTLLPERYAILEAMVPELVYIPEFLNQNSSLDDEISFKKIILGGDPLYTSEVEFLYKGKEIMHTTLEQASMIKYTHNLYSIHKMLFWEMIQDLTEDYGGARLMYKGYSTHKTPDMEVVGLDGYRGIGGKCFPANLEAVKDKHELLKALYEYNAKLKSK